MNRSNENQDPNRGTLDNTNVSSNCIPLLPSTNIYRSNILSSTSNEEPLSNTNGSSQATQVRRPRGRPRLSARALTDITNISGSCQQRQFCAPNVLTTSPFLSGFNVTPALTPTLNIPRPPSQLTTSSQNVPLTTIDRDTVPPLRRRGRPPSQANVSRVHRNVRPCLPPQTDRTSSPTNPTPPVVLSSVTIVDNHGNPMHLPQSTCVTNPATSTRPRVHAQTHRMNSPTNPNPPLMLSSNRVNEGKTLHKAGRLFHTFCVDAYTAVLDHDLDCSRRATMSIRYHHVSDLHPNITDKWTVNVMAARVWTTYNPNNNRVLSMDLIIVDERGTSIHAKIPATLINRFGNRIKEGCVYKIHKFTVVNYGDTKYRPLEIKFFVQFGYTTDIQPSYLQPQLFDRHVFKFVPFGNLQRRIGNDTYLTDVIGVLREWGPLQNNVERVQGCNPQVRKIVIADMSDIKLNISLWGKCALAYEDNIIESKKNTKIVVILTCCRVRLYAGAPQLTTTVSTQFHLNLPIAETLAYNQRHIQPVVFTSTTVETDTLKVTPVTEIYQCLADGATLGTRFIIYGMVIGIDLDKDWKFIQCTKCFHKVTLDGVRYYCDNCKKHISNPRQTYKLVIKVRDNEEDIECVLFNSAATEILGLTVEELITKTLKEGADDPNWIVDYFVDKLFTQMVVLEIKIDKFNLPPTYVKRYTVTKYYGSDVDDLNKHRGSSSISGSVTSLTNSNVSSGLNYSDMVDYATDYENLGTTITEDEEKLMDEIEWNWVSKIVPPITHTVTNQPPVHDEVNATVVQARVDDSVHDVSHASNELTIAVNTVVCPSNATVVREIDEMSDEVNVNNMNFEVNEVAVPQLMEIMQDEGDEEVVNRS
ncbi:replication protein A 70 kDa DNA-binding subunit B [Artemisia annua]|uniref:Replication protein A 70 kDa DNA-binding subunit B n=1 Tax=Artemisia annua TaxID=35608 RepID=A0A2U1LH99_ARTAN|nr:replication protein A 70 kDa DNA-binding subunit B [Artemisia annua]